ncbi:YslB family protein [Fictibacillus iocasae]|uniref:YslB family protein n=1 Tax=Fictibacillus iocasae TaxID=2715437 RepID=A0ABW2NNT1_9BACL
MTNQNIELQLEQTESSRTGVTEFAYELLRSEILPDLLGKEERNILYWTGRQLARKFPLSSIEEVQSFFHDAAWGTLEMEEASKSEMIFMLTSDLIKQRFENVGTPVFGLEAGFLAEQMQSQKKCITEAYETLKKKGRVSITVQWDKKDIIE